MFVDRPDGSQRVFLPKTGWRKWGILVLLSGVACLMLGWEWILGILGQAPRSPGGWEPVAVGGASIILGIIMLLGRSAVDISTTAIARVITLGPWTVISLPVPFNLITAVAAEEDEGNLYIRIYTDTEKAQMTIEGFKTDADRQWFLSCLKPLFIDGGCDEGVFA